MKNNKSVYTIDESDDFKESSIGIEHLIREQLLEIGEDPDREGLMKTPYRVSKAMGYLTKGYHTSPEEVINGAVFEESADEMVIVKGIEFYSLCEHHMLPFFGIAHVGYIPNGKVIGLSKVARLVEIFSRRLQVQERMTQEIAECLQKHLDPRGVGVITEAQHMCMMMRGVQKAHSTTMASAMLGDFRSNRQTRSEFLSLVGQTNKL